MDSNLAPIVFFAVGEFGSPCAMFSGALTDEECQLLGTVMYDVATGIMVRRS
jgi:hypothetical protein